MSTPDRVKSVTVGEFAAKKGGDKLVVVTAYDALFGKLVDDAGVDAVLVGDSVGNVIAGFDSTLPVTLEQMIYHAAAVRRGVKRALLIVDMPFLTYQASIESAILNCGRVMQKTGAHAVKIEGGNQEMADTVRALVRTGIPVMGHLGFTPQSVRTLGGFKVQGREPAAAEQMIADAKRLEEAGVFAIVLELVPAEVAGRVTEAVKVPTIGIGAGVSCDGQVLVLPDMLGLNEGFAPKFLKKYANMGEDVREAVREFARDVRASKYPGDEHSF